MEATKLIIKECLALTHNAIDQSVLLNTFEVQNATLGFINTSFTKTLSLPCLPLKWLASNLRCRIQYLHSPFLCAR